MSTPVPSDCIVASSFQTCHPDGETYVPEPDLEDDTPPAIRHVDDFPLIGQDYAEHVPGLYAFYRYALEVLGWNVEHCVIVAVEKSAPYAVAAYELGETSLKAGWRQVEDLLSAYAMCEVADEWPAYSDQVQPLSLPHWAWNRL